MDKKQQRTYVVGIDVSKDTINASWHGGDSRYNNDRKGWLQLLKETPTNALYAMEATGNYHYRLASFLCEKKKRVKVFNPLSIHYWIKHKLSKSKTDKLDSRYIAEYARTKEAKELPDWQYISPKLSRAKAIITLLTGFSRMERQAGNLGHAVSLSIDKTDNLMNIAHYIENVFKEQKSHLESELIQIARELYPNQYRLLNTIPGIGTKTAAAFVVSCRGFESFPTYKHLSSFVGLVSKNEQSGTTVNIKGHIVKVGTPYLRSLLFMCSFTASKINSLCVDFYNRLLDKGKPKMLALTAVMHRLVKISYGVVKSGEPFRGHKVALA